MKNKNELLLILISAIISCLLKNPYLSDIIEETKFNFYRIIIFKSNSSVITFIWLIPILINILIISRSFYFSLVNFNHRYKNRKNYFAKVFFNTSLKSIIFSLIFIVFQYTLIAILFKVNITPSIKIVSLFLKCAIELYFVSTTITFFALLFNNYIYSYIYTILFLIIGINIFKTQYFPFFSLYYTYKINFISIILLILIVYLLKKLYIKFDLGGIKNETSN